MKKFIAALMITGFIVAGMGTVTANASGSLREIEYQRKKQAESQRRIEYERKKQAENQRRIERERKKQSEAQR